LFVSARRSANLWKLNRKELYPPLHGGHPTVTSRSISDYFSPTESITSRAIDSALPLSVLLHQASEKTAQLRVKYLASVAPRLKSAKRLLFSSSSRIGGTVLSWSVPRPRSYSVPLWRAFACVINQPFLHPPRTIHQHGVPPWSLLQLSTTDNDGKLLFMT
jgi:hypothetical protein